MAYDPSNQTLWVASPSDCVEVFNFSGGAPTSVAQVGAGVDPFGVAFDPVTNEVFVTNTGSNNTTVIDATNYTVVASIPVGTAPYGIAYDPADRDLYVANAGSDTVSVISGASLGVVATIPVGAAPLGVAADPTSGRVFVADGDANSVSVIADGNNSVIATVAVGAHPYGVALDNSSDTVYVTNEGSNNVTAINATHADVVATIPVLAPAVDLQGVAYDPATALLWVGAGLSTVVVVNTTVNQVAYQATDDPSGVAYDPDNGEICVTNTWNRTLGCLSLPDDIAYAATAPLTFTETGLPAGTPWQVTINGSNFLGSADTTQSSTAPTVLFEWPTDSAYVGTYTYSITSPSGATPTPRNGTILGSTAPLSINVTFSLPPGFYPLTFVESGLPLGDSWAVAVGTDGEHSNTSALTFEETNGSFPFEIGGVSGFAPNPMGGIAHVNGTPLEIPVTFQPSPPSAETRVLTLVETGLLPGVVWSATVNGSLFSAVVTGSDSSIAVSAPMGPVDWQVWAISGFLLNAPGFGSVDLTSNQTVRVTFSPIYTIGFVETGLPSGTEWSVTLAGQGTYSTVTSYFQLGTLMESVNFSIGSVRGYNATPPSGSVVTTVTPLVAIVFTPTPPIRIPPAPATYLVDFEETGLPSGADWSIEVNHSTLEGDTPSLSTSLANGTFAFTASGPAGYAPDVSGASIQVAGGPVNLTIAFGMVASSTSNAPSPGGVSTLAFGLGIAGGILAGAILASLIVLAIRRRPQPPTR